jgi:hypothetical protein
MSIVQITRCDGCGKEVNVADTHIEIIYHRKPIDVTVHFHNGQCYQNWNRRIRHTVNEGQ